MRARVGPAAHLGEDLAVRRLAPADEHHGVEPSGKLREVLFAVRYLPADRVVDVHLPRIGGPAAHFGAQPFEQPDALRGLRKEIDRTREVDQLQVLHPFDHDRRVRDLPREAHHFGVAPFAEDHHLPACGAHPFVGLLHAALQPCDHRAGGVDDPDVHFPGGGVGRRRFSVGADEEAAARQVRHVGVGHGPQPQLFEALDLDAVVDDVAQRVDRAALPEGAFGLRDCADNAEAEARFIVDLNTHNCVVKN